MKNNKWLIPVVLFVVLVITYFIRGLFDSRISVELLKEDRIEEMCITQGVLIKKENVKTVSLTGATEIYVKNGDRVSNHQIIAMLYRDTEDESIKAELSDINKKITAIQESNSGSSVFINDVMKIEAELSKYVDEVIDFTCNDNLVRLPEYKYKMSMLAEQKAVANGEQDSSAETLETLRERKNQLERKLGRAENVVSANLSGIFVEGRDGYEEIITYDTYENLTPQDIKTTINEVKNGELITDEEGEYSFKVVDNYSFMVAVNIEKELAKDLKVGDSIVLRFSDFSSGDTKANIKYISSPDSKGTVTVVSECKTHVSGLLEKRIVNVEFVKKSISGYKVPIEYIHTEEEAIGLYIKRGAVMKFIPIEIIYSNEEEAVVSAADPDQPIKTYDEVVTAAPVFENGRVIVSQ